MNTNHNNISIYGFDVETVKKDIKNIHIGVYPPNGRVRVATPLETTDEKIKHIVLTKMDWIKKQQRKFKEQERETKREYVSGESHYFMGKRYRLTVIQTQDKPHVKIKTNTRIHMYVKPNPTVKQKQKVLEDFYRQELKKLIPNLITKWEEKIGITVKEARIKKMKTKWGSCNPKHERIWLNLELAKKPQHCIEYIIVHEMTHILEKNHTKKFRLLMESFMPKWTQHKKELNSGKLGHFTWDYSIE